MIRHDLGTDTAKIIYPQHMWCECLPNNVFPNLPNTWWWVLLSFLKFQFSTSIFNFWPFFHTINMNFIFKIKRLQRIIDLWVLGSFFRFTAGALVGFLIHGFSIFLNYRIQFIFNWRVDYILQLSFLIAVWITKYKIV